MVTRALCGQEGKMCECGEPERNRCEWVRIMPWSVGMCVQTCERVGERK